MGDEGWVESIARRLNLESTMRPRGRNRVRSPKDLNKRPDPFGFLGKYAWFSDNSDGRTHTVGRKLANPWGLHDMHGNVWEWCADQEGSFRQSWGGGLGNTASSCRSAFRYGIVSSFRSGFLGFRVALDAPSAPSPEADK